ncbi:isopentenyl-diphosphate Delta-isomerase [Vibrio fortis]|uniref:Isopentenyl-diphosphate Delta-isomerase n=1 Tax=Vibrio fortis TaxID=212667 RepID=A0A5N3SA26_9VIBR|nr:isopentenyl-diphosphate Delta-isomerase [Vibrio fortis]KAB0303519.1 isopentenyl-diphosphate Delta-isomerase [Vibrio fortis]
MKDEVILVTEDDVEVGHCEKLKAHIDGKLHRAFSLMIAKKTAEGHEFLLQKRASGKYHSGGKWSNSCCSHPRPGEALEDAVQRRVGEELGTSKLLQLTSLGSFIYQAQLENNLTEHELDHIFLSLTNQLLLAPNASEVSEVEWFSIESIQEKLHQQPEAFTVWFPDVFYKVVEHLKVESESVDKRQFTNKI